MTTTARQRGQVLIIMAAWIFFTGGAASALVVYDGATKDTKKAIKRVVKDDERRDALLSYLSYWDSVQEGRDKQVESDREELLDTMRRQDSQRAALDPILAKLDGTFAAMDRDFLDLRFRLKARLSREEWAAILARRGE